MTRIASRLEVRVEDGDTVDNNVLRQRFEYTGRRDSDFTKSDHKARIFVSAQVRKRHLCSNELAKNLWKPVKESSQHGSTVSYEDVFGAKAGGLQRIVDLESKLMNFYAYFASFTIGDANCVDRNNGEGQGLEAWRRLYNWYDPTSSSWRVTIVGHVQNLLQCSNRDGTLRRVQDDSLMAVMWKLRPKRVDDTVTFKSDEDSFDALFNRLVSFASLKQSWSLDDKPVRSNAKRERDLKAIHGS